MPFSFKMRGKFQSTLLPSKYYELGWKTIDELIKFESEIMVFTSAPQYLCDFFVKNSTFSSHSLRNTETDLRLPLKRASCGQKCLSYRGAKLWNSLG